MGRSRAGREGRMSPGSAGKEMSRSGCTDRSSVIQPSRHLCHIAQREAASTAGSSVDGCQGRVGRTQELQRHRWITSQPFTDRFSSEKGTACGCEPDESVVLSDGVKMTRMSRCPPSTCQEPRYERGRARDETCTASSHRFGPRICCQAWISVMSWTKSSKSPSCVSK